VGGQKLVGGQSRKSPKNALKPANSANNGRVRDSFYGKLISKIASLFVSVYPLKIWESS
jgi:hypothetical protein